MNNSFLDVNLLSKITQEIQDDEKKQEETNHNYRPSLYSGIFGTYVVIKYKEPKVKILEYVSAPEMRSEGGGIKMRSEAGGIKMIEYMNNHTLPRPNYDKLTATIPVSIRNKPKNDQLELFASMYKKSLFGNQPKRPKLGGWLLLSTKNYKKTHNAKVSSPEELGFSVIEPKYYGDPEYEKSFIKKVRDGSIVIKSCKGKRGSFYVELELENTSNEDITFEINQGQVFEQNKFRNVQNLAVKNFYQQLPEGCSYSRVNKTMLFSIPKNSTQVFKLECFCIDHKYSGPSGEDMNVAPLICNAAKDEDDQEGVWEQTDKDDIYND